MSMTGKVCCLLIFFVFCICRIYRSLHWLYWRSSLFNIAETKNKFDIKEKKKCFSSMYQPHNIHRLTHLVGEHVAGGHHFVAARAHLQWVRLEAGIHSQAGGRITLHIAAVLLHQLGGYCCKSHECFCFQTVLANCWWVSTKFVFVYYLFVMSKEFR